MSTLRGIIYSKYRSVSDFARAIGWDIAKARRVINGRQKPTLNDVREITEATGLDEETFINVFFGSLSTMWRNGGKKVDERSNHC